MKIGLNKVVSFHYRLNETGQAVMEDSREDSPMVYLHGHNAILKGLEQALADKQSGDRFTIDLTAEQAYGQRQDSAVQRVSINHVYNPSKAKAKFKPGMVVQLNTKNGLMPVVVLKVGLKTLDVDLNHPLAGKDLTFEIEVIEVRDATPEEIEHGHVHGEGGHHH